MIQIDMPMPDNCDECRLNTEYAFCKAMPDNFCGNTDDRKRPEWCPLKEQEAVEPILEKLKFSETWVCGNCQNELFEGAVIRDNYCSNCGRPVLWEGR